MDEQFSMKDFINDLDCIPDKIKKLALANIKEVEINAAKFYEEMFTMNLNTALDALDFELDDYEKEFTETQLRQLIVAGIFYAIVGCNTMGSKYTFGKLDDEYYVFDLYGGQIIEAIHVYETDNEYLDDSLVPPYDFKCLYEDMTTHYLRRKDHPLSMN